MNRFVRIILMILVAGAAVNMSVVLLANARSHRLQVAQNRQSREALQALVVNASNHVRRADFVIELQQRDAHEQVSQTTLLVRQYASIGPDPSLPLKVARIVIPGDRLSVDGVVLDFSNTFAQDLEDYQLLRGGKLAYFGTICGEDEHAPLNPLVVDDRFTYLPRSAPPQLTSILPDERPSMYEIQAWYYIWSLIPETIPPSGQYAHQGLTVTWLKPKVTTVRLGVTYTAYVSSTGVQVDENAIPIPGLRDAMLSEGKKIGQELAP